MEETNTTISYYNHNADRYFNNTVNVDMSECCDRFIKYVVPGGKIIDIGAGSGRDIKYFKDRGFVVEAIDAFEKMCQLASDYSGVEVQCQKIQDWRPQGIYDGIWANASLLHLTIDEVVTFILRTSGCLDIGGVVYASMKKGVETGYDSSGRLFTDFSEEIVQQIMAKITAFDMAEIWETEDRMSRGEFQWLNLILKKVDN